MTYIDENPDNRTAEGQEHVVSVATLGWPRGAVSSAAEARALLLDYDSVLGFEEARKAA